MNTLYMYARFFEDLIQENLHIYKKHSHKEF